MQSPTPAQAARLTVDIDGVARPRVNSAGQPIHATEDGIRNFWRWFGASRAIDEQTGTPVVMLHGTGNSFHWFDRHAYTAREGFYFTPDHDMAWDFAENAADGIAYSDDEEACGAAIMPVYLSIKNPVDVRAGWPLAVADLLEDVINHEWLTTLPPGDFWLAMDGDDGYAIRTKLESLGYDGLLASELNTPVFVAFQPSQIKSALGNSGDFNPATHCLCDSRPVLPVTGLRDRLLAMDESLDQPSASAAAGPGCR